MNKPSISLINLGCSKNLVDSEIMLGLLNDAGYEILLDEQNADLIIINTCSFIHDAEKESVKAIMEQVAAGRKIIIVGCLAQKHGEEILELIPEASALVGTSDIKDIVSIVEEVTENPNSQCCRLSSDLNFLQTDDIKRYHITMGPYSYIKIAEGCNWRCTYCLIPDLKGHFRSRKIDSIVKEAEILAKNGVAEIILIAQDTTSYGIDIYGHPALVDLLVELEKIDEIKWVRLMYTYPKYFTDELIDFIASSKKVVKYLDIPLQHAHPTILHSMKRPDTNVNDLLFKLRSKINNLALRTCFIVGFPGETEDQYQCLYDFVKKHEFERVGVFEYSREKGTPASKMPGQIKAKVKKERRSNLMKLQNKISLKKHQALIGKNMEVLLESISEYGSGVGRSYLDAPEIDGLVYVNTVLGNLPGDIITVKITKVTAYDLHGVLEH